jgi:hypothetical protein
MACCSVKKGTGTTLPLTLGPISKFRMKPSFVYKPGVRMNYLVMFDNFEVETISASGNCVQKSIAKSVAFSR